MLYDLRQELISQFLTVCVLQSINSQSSLTAPLRHFLGSVWAAALCSARPATPLCTSWTAVDILQQPPDSQMPFPNCQHRQTGCGVPGAGRVQRAHAEMGSSTGDPKAWVRSAFTPGGCGGAWLGKLAWQCRKLTPWVWFHLGCSKEINNGKTSRFFWKASSCL